MRETRWCCFALPVMPVVAYAVAQRTNELGIRIALGARPGDLTRLVVRDVTAVVITGIAVGSALSWTGVALLESSVAQILGVNPFALAPVAPMIVACGAAAALSARSDSPSIGGERRILLQAKRGRLKGGCSQDWLPDMPG